MTKGAVFFASSAAMRTWLDRHHASARELVVGFHKVHTRKPSLTWTESVREALCFGWIDGVRHSIDEDRYQIRFTPRKPSSIWSRLNVRHVEELIAAGRMTQAGLRAYAAREESHTGRYSFEQRLEALPEPWASELTRHPAAAVFFAARPASYRRAAIWWVISAKKDETKASRLARLVALSAKGETLPALTPRTAPKKAAGKKTAGKKATARRA